MRRTTRTCACCQTQNSETKTGLLFIGEERYHLCCYCLAIRLQAAIDQLRPEDAERWITHL